MGRTVGSKNKKKFHRKSHRLVGEKTLPLPYKEAVEWVAKELLPKGIDTRLKWVEYSKNLPPFIPRHPQNVYKGEGWYGWKAFFGYKIDGFRGSLFMTWCLANGVTVPTIRHFTEFSEGTVQNMWKGKHATKSTINWLHANIPQILEKSIRDRISKGDEDVKDLTEKQVQQLIEAETLTKEELTKKINTVVDF